MFKEIFLFELKLGFRKPSNYVYFLFMFAMTLLMALGEVGVIGMPPQETNLHVNSAISIAQSLLSVGGMSNLLASIFLISIMATAIQRDYQFNMHPLLFTKPIEKSSYFFGRFLGVLTLAVIVFSGLLAGYMTGFMAEPDSPVLGPFRLLNYIQPFLIFILPNLLFLGAIFFSVTTFLRTPMAAYVFALVLTLINAFVGDWASDMDNKFAAAILEPSGSRALGFMTQYWTSSEQNANLIPMEGPLLWNRILWLGISLLITLISYRGFSFSQFLEPLVAFSRKNRDDGSRMSQINLPVNLPVTIPEFNSKVMWTQLSSLARIEFIRMVRSALFIVLSLLGLSLALFSYYMSADIYDTKTYLVTYMVIESYVSEIASMSYLFIIFYSGVSIWRARENKMDELIGVTPVSNGILFFSKLLAMIFAVLLLLLLASLTGIALQIHSGFYEIDLWMYFVNIFQVLIGTAAIAAVAFSFQVFSSNKYFGYFLVMIPLVIFPLLFSIFDWNGSLYRFNSSGDSRPYSDMNSYGGVFAQWPIFKIYWWSIIGILFLLALALYFRGKESSIKARWKLSALFSRRVYKYRLVQLLLIALVSGSFIFWQENVLVDNRDSETLQKESAEIEKRYRPYLRLPLPRIKSVTIHADIYPDSKELHVKGKYLLVNNRFESIDTLYIDYPGGLKSAYHINRLEPSADFSIVDQKQEYGILIMRLKKSLRPGDSLFLDFDMSYRPQGLFARMNSPVVDNGTFINNMIFPTLGYNEDVELLDNNSRKKYGLGPKPRMAAVNDSVARMNNYISHDADWVRFEATVSTKEGQTAIAPGYLQREWKADGRHYFHYRMDSPILNFYSFLSANYAVKRDKWKGVNIEIYYHPSHEYNLSRMVKAIKRSLDYYTVAFGPYQHRQVRIIEFPRYADFAQSFPNTIPYSESIGFIQKVEEGPEKIDMPFYVTAHEVAHQWWAHQVIGGNVQGSVLMSETMSQYAALMVMEKEYGKQSMRKFLKYEMDQYLKGRTFEWRGELPLMLCENQQYIHYNKGSVAMYALRDLLGEETLNNAIRAYLQKNKFQDPPYTTSIEFVEAIRKETPDSLKYLITDLFERITLYENYVKSLSYEKMKDGNYRVRLTVGSAKFYSDSLGNQKRVGVRDYMDIGIFGDGKIGEGKELVMQRIRMDAPEKRFEFIVKEKPVKAGIDPYLKLIDRTPDNNLCKFGETPAKPDLDTSRSGEMFRVVF
jgi:ABC-2 type transport system permease protein